jgi:hypothetical protein
MMALKPSRERLKLKKSALREKFFKNTGENKHRLKAICKQNNAAA